MIRTILATPPEVVRQASAEERARVASVLDHVLPVSARRLGLVNDAVVTSRLERYELESIAAPTLVLSVEDDLYGTYETGRYTAEHIPGARFVGYPTGGHLWVGHQQEIMAEITGFVRSHTP
jgi:pimeloyl-ACP methyl ester carboxylesterase